MREIRSETNRHSVAYGNRRHGVDNGASPVNYCGVVPAGYFQLCVFVFYKIDCILLFAD